MAMSPILLPLLPLMAAVPVMAGQDASQQASDVDVITLGRDMHDRMTVPVKVIEQGPFEFLIDTGAQNTVLSKSLASRLSLAPEGRARLIGVAGSEMVDTVQVEQIDLGSRSYYAILSPLLEETNIGADGILGLDSLQGQRVLIDFRKRLIAVDEAKALGGSRGFDIVVTARRRSGQLIMANAKIDGISTEVVIDTGAETSIGNRALQNAMAHRKRMSDQTTLHSVTGQRIQADVGFARELVLDQVKFVNVMIAYADSPPFEALGLAKRPALLLGMRDLRALDRVAIDFSTRRIMFDLPAGAM